MRIAEARETAPLSVGELKPEVRLKGRIHLFPATICQDFINRMQRVFAHPYHEGGAGMTSYGVLDYCLPPGHLVVSQVIAFMLNTFTPPSPSHLENSQL